GHLDGLRATLPGLGSATQPVEPGQDRNLARARAVAALDRRAGQVVARAQITQFEGFGPRLDPAAQAPPIVVVEHAALAVAVHRFGDPAQGIRRLAGANHALEGRGLAPAIEATRLQPVLAIGAAQPLAPRARRPFPWVRVAPVLPGDSVALR